MECKSNKKYKEIKILIFLNLITSLILFAPFIFGKYVYMYSDWGYDTYHQYVPEIKLLCDTIKMGDSNALLSFRVGLGSDFLSIQKWITDPFIFIIIIIAIITDTSFVPYLMILNPILVSLASTVLCYCFLNLFGTCKKYGMIIASYIYGMCGYLIATGQHYWFASFLVYNILTLIFIELMLRNKKNRVWFITMIFFVSIHGAYGALPILLSSGIYLIIRLIANNNNIKGFIFELTDFIICIIIGILLSMVIFLPNLNEIVNVSGRVNNENIFLKIIKAFQPINRNQSRSALLRLFSNNLEGTVNNWHGVEPHFTVYPFYFSVIFVICLIQYFINTLKNCKNINIKKKIIKMVSIGIILFSLLFDFVPQLFNLFSYSQYRMIYVVLPFFAVVIAEVLEQIEVGMFSVKVSIFSIGFCLLLVPKEEYIEGAMVCVALLIFIILFYVLSKTHNNNVKNTIKILIGIMLMINLIGDHAISLYYDRIMTSSEQVERNYYSKVYTKEIDWINQREKDNFIRVDRTFLGEGIADANASYIFPYRSTSNYNSILNYNTKEFISNIVKGEMDSFKDIQVIYAENEYGFAFNNIMADLLGLKYVFSNKPRVCRNWNLVVQHENHYIYENKNLKTAGILYSSYVTEQEFEKYNLLQKNLVLGNSVVVNSKVQNVKSGIVEDTNVSRNIETVMSGNVQTNEAIIIPVGKENVNTDSYQEILSFSIKTDVECKMNVYIETSEEGRIPGTVKKTIASNKDKEIAICIPDDAQRIILEFDKNLFYFLSDVEVSSVSCGYETDNIELVNKNYLGKVDGKVSTENDSLLYIAIPYLKGWVSYIDGKKTEIYRANYGFMAIEIPSGEHHVVFEYHNPIIKYGIILTFVGLLLAIIYLKKMSKIRKFC